jgi:hypothetical protein
LSESGDGPLQRDVNTALRERSVERLQEGFTRYVGMVSGDAAWDARDEMVNMTPFIDCARRLGVDPAAVLGPIAATGGDQLRELFDMFVARTDVTLEAFGWSIAETPSGPAYRWQ